MVPNWRVLNDGWGTPGTGAERWLESPEDAIADTGNEDKDGSLFWSRVCVSRQVARCWADTEQEQSNESSNCRARLRLAHSDVVAVLQSLTRRVVSCHVHPTLPRSLAFEGIILNQSQQGHHRPLDTV
jgi:hypothetical protein